MRLGTVAMREEGKDGYGPGNTIILPAGQSFRFLGE